MEPRKKIKILADLLSQAMERKKTIDGDNWKKHFDDQRASDPLQRIIYEIFRDGWHSQFGVKDFLEKLIFRLRLYVDEDRIQKATKEFKSEDFSILATLSLFVFEKLLADEIIGIEEKPSVRILYPKPLSRKT